MRHMTKVGTILTYAAMALAVLMLLGSCDYKTRREFEPTEGRAVNFDADEFDQWAALTSLCSLIAIALLGNVAATVAPQHGGRPGSPGKAIGLVAAALALFALGANIAWGHWLGVIAEQQRAAYSVQIAYGLPVVTYAGAFGAVVCALLFITLLVAKWRIRTTSLLRR